MPGELSRRDCPIFPSLPDLKRWEQLIPRENDCERSHALMVSACSTTCGSMAIVRIRRQDLLELFVERTGKKPWDKKPMTKIRTSQCPHKVSVCLTRRKRLGVLFRRQISESHGSTASALAASKDCSTFSFSTCFKAFETRILRQLPWIFTWVSEWSVSEKCVIDTTTTKKKNCLRHSINTPHGKD